MKPGIYPGLSFDEYRSIHAVNKSSLVHIMRSPMHYYAALTEEKTPSKAMELGTAIHCSILEPLKFVQRYVTVPPGAPRRPTAAQLNAKKPSEESIKQIAWWSEFDAKSQGKIIIDDEEWETIKAITTIVRDHPAFQVLFSKGSSETAIVWEDPETGIPCKGLIDWLTDSHVVDLKTTDDGSPDAFAKSCARFHYHVQAAWYVDGLKALGRDVRFVFGAIEKEIPHGVAFYFASEEMLAKGREIYRAWLTRYSQCLKLNEWPGYPVTINEINLPVWAMKERADGTVEF